MGELRIFNVQVGGAEYMLAMWSGATAEDARRIISAADGPGYDVGDIGAIRELTDDEARSTFVTDDDGTNRMSLWDDHLIHYGPRVLSCSEY